MMLDPKEETIVAAYIANGSNQVEAWRVGNPNSKAKPQTQHEMASKFFAQHKVRTRIMELHVEVAAKLSDDAALTLDQHMRELRELRDQAKSLNQIGAAVRAEQLRGEARRFYVKQVEQGDAGDFSRMSDEELRAFVYGEDDKQACH